MSDKNEEKKSTRQRIVLFAAHLGISLNALENECGIGNGAFSRDSVSNNNIDKLLSKFPELSRNWIMFGEGKMFVSEGESLEDRVKKLETDLADIKDALFRLLLRQPSIHNNQAGDNINFNVEGK